MVKCSRESGTVVIFGMALLFKQDSVVQAIWKVSLMVTDSNTIKVKMVLSLPKSSAEKAECNKTVIIDSGS